MKIIIAGAGDLGVFIAKYLEQYEEYSISIIDRDVNVLRELTDTHSFGGVVGECTSLQVLQEVNIKSASMIIACTPNDETNLLLCQIADSFGVPVKIPRLRNQIYLSTEWQELFLLNKISVNSVISPEVELASSLQSRIAYSSHQFSDLLTFKSENIKVFSIFCGPDCLSINKNISILENLLYQYGAQAKIIAIYNSQNEFFIPGPEYSIKEEDKLFICAPNDKITICCDIISSNSVYKSQDQALKADTNPNIIITGDTDKIKNVATFLSKIYKNKNIKVVANLPNSTLVEWSVFFESYKNISVINDDITQPNEYKFNYIKNDGTDTFIVINNQDKQTVFVSLVLKASGYKNIYPYLSNNYYEELLYSYDVHNVLTNDAYSLKPILSNLRKGLILSVYPMHNSAEILEIEVKEQTDIIGKKVSDIESKKAIKIACILNQNDDFIDVQSNITIKEDYKIVVIAMKQYIKDVEDLLVQHN